MCLLVICGEVVLFALRSSSLLLLLLFYDTTSDLEHLKVWQKRGPPHETEVSQEAMLVTWAAEVKRDPAKM